MYGIEEAQEVEGVALGIIANRESVSLLRVSVFIVKLGGVVGVRESCALFWRRGVSAV